VTDPGGPADRIIAETIFALWLLLLFTNIASPAQYAAVAWKRPLIDRWLAGADAWMGLNVTQLAAWMRSHPRTAGILSAAYSTLLLQFILPIVFHGLVYRDRDRLWEFVFHFHVCLTITVAALALVPVATPSNYYGFHSTIDQIRFVYQFNGFRDGTLHTIRFNELEGLISMPSFHVAGALMVTWVFRGRWLFWPLAVINCLLIAATFMSGVHYVIDAIGTFPVFAASLAAYKWWGEPLVRRPGGHDELAAAVPG
jgi:hypothetical protein